MFSLIQCLQSVYLVRYLAKPVRARWIEEGFSWKVLSNMPKEFEYYLGQLESLRDINQGRDLIRFAPYEKD